jgi:hypothetical protein
VPAELRLRARALPATLWCVRAAPTSAGAARPDEAVAAGAKRPPA